jgi:hypothetical protein
VRELESVKYDLFQNFLFLDFKFRESHACDLRMRPYPTVNLDKIQKAMNWVTSGCGVKYTNQEAAAIKNICIARDQELGFSGVLIG